jgi:hypothetical protein
MHWIAGQTVGSGGGNITFTSIPQTFTHLHIRIFGRGTASFTPGLAAYVQFNGDGTAANYNVHQLFGDGSSVATNAYLTAGTLSLPQVLADSSATSGIFGTAIFDILDYTNTNKNKISKASGGWDRNGGGRASVSSGAWLSTAAINQIYVGTDGNLVEGTRVDIYGINSNPIATGA